MKTFKNVICCGWSSDPSDLTFGTLERFGYLTKHYVPGEWGDDIVWTVVGDIEFTTEYDETHRKGDVIVWEK